MSQKWYQTIRRVCLLCIAPLYFCWSATLMAADATCLLAENTIQPQAQPQLTVKNPFDQQAVENQATQAIEDVENASLTSKAIYNKDNRQELYKASERHRRAAASVAALFETSALSRPSSSNSGKQLLPVGPTGLDKNWCPDERFASQPAIAKCTAFLVTPTLLVTSAHCVRPKDKPFRSGMTCDEMSVVFDYAMVNEKQLISRELATHQVYQCQQLLNEVYEPQGSDWAVIELDRPVEQRPTLKLYTGDLPNEAQLSVIGYPMGLPLKVSDNAKVLKQDHSAYFVTDSDTYAGNSGSPVFISFSDDSPLQVVGILSRGEIDFDSQEQSDGQSCLASRICDDQQCQGEHVIRITEVAILSQK